MEVDFKDKVIGLDTECTKAPRHYPWVEGSYLVSASVVNLEGVRKSWLFNHPEQVQSQRRSLDELTEILHNAKRVVAHNAKFDLLWLLDCGIPINNLRVYCTQVAEYLIRGQVRGPKGSLSLEQLSKDYGISDKIDKCKTFWESGYETDEIPASILLPYGEQDTINCLAIYMRQAEKLVQLNLQTLCTLQCEMSKVLSQVEYNGMLVNREQLRSYSYEYASKIADMDRELVSIVRDKIGIAEDVFNLGSDYDLSAILYGGRIRWEGKETVSKVRKDGTERTYERKCVHEILIPDRGLGFLTNDSMQTKREGVFKTDMETLKNLKCKEGYQRRFIELIIERSKLCKLKSTYFDGLLDKVMSDGRIHPSMNQTVTRTGRLSSSNPNGTNMPRGSTGPVKRNFISRYP